MTAQLGCTWLKSAPLLLTPLGEINKESKQLSMHSLGGLLLGLGLSVGELDVHFLGFLDDSESIS